MLGNEPQLAKQSTRCAAAVKLAAKSLRGANLVNSQHISERPRSSVANLRWEFSRREFPRCDFVGKRRSRLNIYKKNGATRRPRQYP